MAVLALAFSLGPGSTTVAGAAEVRTDGICLTVHNEGDPMASRVYGVRYYRSEPDRETRVIVLVHGNSVTHAFWDVHPDFSVARRLAEAGYLVVTYDRLGYGNSPYLRPDGAGYSLSLSSQRSMLHEIVVQIKTGAYGFAAAGSCAGAGPTVGVASPSVVIVGHSAGGAIVSGYPGRFHDVAAMVQAGFSNQGMPAEAGLYLASVWGPQAAAGKDYWAIAPTVADCERAVLYRPGLFSSIFPDVCRPPSFGEAPAGEAGGLGRVVAENQLAIHQVGAGTPILLAWEDHDFFFPESTASSETGYWKAHCGCDVESWTQQDTGHALVAHRSMPTFTTEVVAWLARKGLGPEVGE